MLTKELCHKYFEYKEGVLYRKYVECESKTYNTKYAGKATGNLDRNGHLRLSLNNQRYAVHRVIFLMFHGYLPEEVDHKNNIRTDNRIENLRAATTAQNRQNALMPKTNTSGIKGVSWHKQNKCWRCVLWAKNKSKEVGGFSTKELAEEFMQLWREMAHGEFANHGKIF